MGSSATDFNSTILVLVDDPIGEKKPGGVQLLFSEIRIAAMKTGLKTITTTTNDIFRVVEMNSSFKLVVFVQTPGRLSKQYREWALKLLESGAEIIEENIFALASRYRPVHPNYTMALMSIDGSYRYSYRSFWSRSPKMNEFLHLPNPLYIEASRKPKPPTQPTSPFVFLRIGRPDPIKWSNFEIRFVEKIARDLPSTNFQLKLVGYPQSQITRTNIANLEVLEIPYSKSVAELYANSDCYIHHSAKGETFGNTIMEAFHSNLPIIYAADLYWDQAPTTIYGPESVIWSTPSKLLKNSTEVFERLVNFPSEVSWERESLFNRTEDFITSIMNRDRSRQLHPIPTGFKFPAFLKGVSDEATITPSAISVIWAMVLEALRAIKNRWKTD
jgi:hypothetical protein